MYRTLLIATVSIAYGCADGGAFSATGTTPKRAAELCNGEVQSSGPAGEVQQKTLAAYRAGEISFNECLLRLRG